MRHTRFIIILFILSLTIIAGGKIMAEMAGTKAMPGPDAAALWKYMTEENPYLGYQCWPNKMGFYKGREPHGSILRTFVNAKAYLTVVNKKGMFPAGAIIVKENYSPKMDLAAITVMYKIKGYDPPNNDWYWVKYGPVGKALDEGKVKGCIDCHSAKKDNDYTFTGTIK